MKAEYQFKYDETLEVLTDIMELHGASKVSKNFRIFVASGGVFVFVFMAFYSDYFKGSTGHMVFAFAKFLIGWALAFIIAEILARTVGRKFELTASAGDAETVYEKRLKIYKKPLSVRVDFYENSCISYVEKNKKETAYSDVQRILENDTVIAFIVRGEEFGKRSWGLSKKGLTDGDIDGFRTFLLQKCTGVKKGIEEIKTK